MGGPVTAGHCRVSHALAAFDPVPIVASIVASLGDDITIRAAVQHMEQRSGGREVMR